MCIRDRNKDMADVSDASSLDGCCRDNEEDEVHLCRASTDGETRGARWLRLSAAMGNEQEAGLAMREWDSFWEMGLEPDAADRVQIQKDMNRTFADEEFSTGVFTSTLKRLLTVVSYYHPDGYTQSMNFIAAMALQQLHKDVPGVQEHQVYGFVKSMFTHLIPGYHTKHLTAVQVDSLVLRDLFRECHPATYQALEEQMITPEVLCVEWLLGIHTTTLSLPAAACLWDVLLSRGRNQLLRCCLLLLEYCAASDGSRDPRGLLHSMRTRLRSCTEKSVKQMVREGAAGLEGKIPEARISELQLQHRRELTAMFENRQLKHSILRLQAHTTLTPQVADQLQRQLRELKGDQQSGGLSRDQFRQMLGDVPNAAGLARLLFDTLDADQSDDLSAAEILRGLALTQSRSAEGFVRQLCELFDADASGSLDRAETRVMVDWLMRIWEHPPTEEQVEDMVSRMFSTLDADQSGTLDPDELALGCSSFPLMTQCYGCLLYTSDAADEEDSVDLGGRRIIKKKKK
eukprot:TRINITY_DN5605_c0_g1_i3.p1 TRINITY_DN5605_c0_g1~~TRINITY_DN5605_c0_g1_i3.p1  ORF type:complete len:516 (-),score=138.60 TRINITY_DN5605_c0_g1_i3:41-1588(-)